MWNRRSGLGRATAFSSSASVNRPSNSARPASPARPISSDRNAFCSACLNVRPMAIVSPTDFICVVSVSSDPWNFSNAKRGAFTTM